MCNKKIYLLIALLFSANIYGQGMWSLQRGYLLYSFNNISIDSIKNIISKDTVGSDFNQYEQAALYLYIYYGTTEKDFLMNNLKTRIDTSIKDFNLDFSWHKYYRDKYILGLLGDRSAIQGMDSVVKYSSNGILESEAIYNLAEAGIYNYYDRLKQGYIKNGSNELTLALYARDPRYTDEIVSLIYDHIKKLNNNIDIAGCARILGHINKKYEIDVLETYFKSTSGIERFNYFHYLSQADKDGQPERSIKALSSEPDDTCRAAYIPFMDFIKDRYQTKRYLTPGFIKSLSDLSDFPVNSFTNKVRLIFLNQFKPFVPDSTLPLINMLDTLGMYLKESHNYLWLRDDNYYSFLSNKIDLAKNYIIYKDSTNSKKEIELFQSSVKQIYFDSVSYSPKYINYYAYKYLYNYAQYISDRLPKIISGLPVKLVSSSNNNLTSGLLQYYEGGWKDAINNNDGTFFVNTTQKTVSLRMAYEYGTQTISNVTVGNDTAIFRTVNVSARLTDSHGNLIDTGKVQYYAGAWRDFGTTTNGVANKELLPNTYSFRMTYAYASTDKQQNIGSDANVVFQTVNAAVQLKNSSGTLMDQGTVQYYAGAWRDFGATTNGVANKELLPNTYSFRMTYAYASSDKQQNIGNDANVVFQTVNAAVQLKNSLGTLMDQGTVQYYAGAWRDFGTTTNGVAYKELLPNSYSFRMTYEYVSKDITQNLNTSGTVNFSTVLCTISVKDSSGNPINNADAKYYAGAWRDIGLTSGGIVTKELLPANLSFRVISGRTQKDKTQNLSSGSTVEFTLP